MGPWGVQGQGGRWGREQVGACAWVLTLSLPRLLPGRLSVEGAAVIVMRDWKAREPGLRTLVGASESPRETEPLGCGTCLCACACPHDRRACTLHTCADTHEILRNGRV